MRGPFWRKEKAALKGAAFLRSANRVLALAGFEPALRLVDHVDAALAAHNPAIPVARLQGAKRVLDLHVSLQCRPARVRRLVSVLPGPFGSSGISMVGTTRFELVTPSMSTKCSTTELSAHLAPMFSPPQSLKACQSTNASALYRRSRNSVQGLSKSPQKGL